MRSSALRTAGCAALLITVNVWICRELFRTEYTQHLGSIEGAYVALSRWVLENWRDLTWFPLWYGGIPFQNSYPPLLHLTVAGAAALGGLSPALAHHAVTAALYCLGSVTLFWLALRLGGDRLCGLLAGLVFSLLSPAAFLIPAVAGDLGSVWRARRLHALVHYGEGPHVASLALLPAAIVLLGLALEKRRAGWYLAAALGLASVVLTNWLGGAALAAAAAAWLLACEADWRTWGRALGVALYGYLLASPWIPPSTLAAINRNARRVGGEYRPGLEELLGWVLVIAVLPALDAVLRRRRASRLARFAALYSWPAAAVTLAAEWFGVMLLPQPHRYHLEMEMGLALLAGVGLRRALAARRRAAAVALGVLLLAGGAAQLRQYRRFARELIRPIEMTGTIEYRTARWFGEHMGGRRVMAPGSISFWMNAFADTPQLGGGFEQGITNPQIPAVMFQVYSGMNAGEREGEIALLWLKAFGVHAVAVGGGGGREYYKPFRNPAKFRGLLPELWREGEDVVYQVPQRTASPARVVRLGDLVRRPPPSAVDVGVLAGFVAALDDPSLPAASWRWLNRHEALITADLSREHALSIAISHHPGWEARVNGVRTAVESDGLGLMVLQPGCQGPCRIELVYTGGREMQAARVASWGGLLAGLLAAIRPRRRSEA